MNVREIALVTTVVVTLATCGSTRAGEDDLNALQGKWRVVSVKYNGGNFGWTRGEKMFVVFDKDEIRVGVEGSNSDQGAKFAVDPKQNPKQINFLKETRDSDWVPQLNLKLFRRYKLAGGKLVPVEGKVEGIYKLDGDSLTLCWRTTEAKEIVDGKATEARLRPTLFQSQLYYQQFLFVLERVKPEK